MWSVLSYERMSLQFTIAVGQQNRKIKTCEATRHQHKKVPTAIST
jgi:hypothetical protein